MKYLEYLVLKCLLKDYFKNILLYNACFTSKDGSLTVDLNKLLDKYYSDNEITEIIKKIAKKLNTINTKLSTVFYINFNYNLKNKSTLLTVKAIVPDVDRDSVKGLLRIQGIL